MLVLTRQSGEKFKIGDDITVAILGVKGGSVRLGIEAPFTVDTRREEIYSRIQASKRPK